MGRRRLRSAAAAVVVAGTLAGCGVSATGRPAQQGQQPAARAPLATAVSGTGASWAIVRLAGAGGVQDPFWQLLISTGGGRWRLVTPPGVADTGGLAVAAAPGGTLTAGFLPSELLTFTPLAMSSDGGASWSQGLLSVPLAPEPDALAALPDGRLLAITARSAEMSSPHARSWSALVTVRALAASPAGRACGLTALTAAGAGPGGAPLLAGDCGRPGKVGIFTSAGGSWQAASLALPGSLTGQRIAVLRLASTGTGAAALLAAGTGRQQVLIPAWATGHRTTWTLGRPFNLNDRQVESVSVGTSDQWGLVLSGQRGAVLGPAAGPGATWQTPLTLPASTATLLPGAGQITAMAPGDSAVAVWQLVRGSGWHQTQLISVPAISGSSG
ncbi:MAG TPA: hypothetical protein VN840_07955 [Streptosporangiaceae bacterium]|nr:hypothetical protein [Streptosporangiaceae bacterium]